MLPMAAEYHNSWNAKSIAFNPKKDPCFRKNRLIAKIIHTYADWTIQH